MGKGGGVADDLRTTSARPRQTRAGRRAQADANTMVKAHEKATRQNCPENHLLYMTGALLLGAGAAHALPPDGGGVGPCGGVGPRRGLDAASAEDSALMLTGRGIGLSGVSMGVKMGLGGTVDDADVAGVAVCDAVLGPATGPAPVATPARPASLGGKPVSPDACMSCRTDGAMYEKPCRSQHMMVRARPTGRQAEALASGPPLLLGTAAHCRAPAHLENVVERLGQVHGRVHGRVHGWHGGKASVKIAHVRVVRLVEAMHPGRAGAGNTGVIQLPSIASHSPPPRHPLCPVGLVTSTGRIGASTPRSLSSSQSMHRKKGCRLISAPPATVPRRCAGFLRSNWAVSSPALTPHARLCVTRPLWQPSPPFLRRLPGTTPRAHRTRPHARALTLRRRSLASLVRNAGSRTLVLMMSSIVAFRLAAVKGGYPARRQRAAAP